MKPVTPGEWAARRSVDVRAVERAELRDLRDEPPPAQRALRTLCGEGNPYCFRWGPLVVKLCFAPEEETPP